MNARKVYRSAMVFSLTAAFAVLSISAFAQATPPGRVNYQGVVRDTAGVPLNGPVTMTFRLYDAASVGTLLWEETYSATNLPQVTVSSGLFSVALGDPTHRTAGSEALFPNVFALHATVYLAVAVGLDAEMTPRIQVVSAPFAENADTLDGTHAAGFASAIHPHSAADITSGTLVVARGGTGLSSVGASGNILTSNGTVWTSAAPPAGGTPAVVDAYNTTLTRYGTGTGPDPYKLALNLGNANAWTGAQTFNANTNFPGSGIWNTSGQVGIGIAPTLYSLDVLSSGATAMRAIGLDYGGYFGSSGHSGYVYAGFQETGISAWGNSAGGYFKDLNGTGYANVGLGDVGIDARGLTGIDARGNSVGGYFKDIDSSGYANVGYGDYGIQAQGNLTGGYFVDLDSTGYAFAGYMTYKVFGNGTVSFVQNHPAEKDKVIVYACPEGDEVATYTRGTAKLVNGEARVKLGETFKWVTNPDIGLTAHLTPHGRGADLYVDSLSTSELVVKCDDPKAADVVFDFLVYGLRIGFEESSIVQEKQQESYIPSFKDHRERYAKYPALRAFNSLERFKTMESSVRGVPEGSLDLSRAKTLKDAIHEYDPATDPPVEKLFGHDQAQQPTDATRGSSEPAVSTPSPALPGSQPVAPSHENAANGPSEAVREPTSGGAVELRPALPCFPSSQAVEAGDVVAMDLSQRGYVRRCTVLADPLVVGIAAGPGDGCKSGQPSEEKSAPARVPVATSGVLSCKVDATFGPIREGDLLVASPTPGHAMRADSPSQGTVIGKALEPLAGGTGLVKILVMLR